MLSLENIKPMSRAVQIELYTWDVFICHAGPDKLFALALSKRLRPLLRCFVDESSLPPGAHAPPTMKDAVDCCQIAIVLLSNEFFRRVAPKEELGWILEHWSDDWVTVVPVYFGLTVEQCSELATEAGLGKVKEITGLRHMGERSRLDGIPINREDTMNSIVRTVRALTGV